MRRVGRRIDGQVEAGGEGALTICLLEQEKIDRAGIRSAALFHRTEERLHRKVGLKCEGHPASARLRAAD